MITKIIYLYWINTDTDYCVYKITQPCYYSQNVNVNFYFSTEYKCFFDIEFWIKTISQESLCTDIEQPTNSGTLLITI